MANRRSVLIGLGGLVAGGGALLGTGAFTTVTAERTVNVETAGDADAFLGLEPADRDGEGNNEYVSSPGDGTTEITLVNNEDTSGNASGVNQNAETIIRNLVTITNNGTQDVTTLNLEFISEGSDDDNLTLSDTFGFTASSTGASNNEATDIANGSNILSTSAADDDGELGPGESINFGIIIDLLDGGNENDALPGDASFNLQITAETSGSSTGNDGESGGDGEGD